MLIIKVIVFDADLLGEKSVQAEEEKDTIFHHLKEIESLRKNESSSVVFFSRIAVFCRE